MAGLAEWLKSNGQYTNAQATTRPTNTTPVSNGQKRGLREWREEQLNATVGTDINSWITSANNLMSQYGGLASSWKANDDPAYQTFNDERSRLLSYAGNYRQMYQGNNDAINAINSVVKSLSDARTNDIQNYWSQWDSAEQYNTAKHNYDLYQKYNPYTQEQIDAELAGMDQQNPDRAWLEDYSRQKKYLDLDKNADFAANSRYESTKTGEARLMPTWDGGVFVTDTGYGDILYDYINRNQDAIETQNINDINSGATTLGLDSGFLQTMTDDEIARFNYIYKTQGKDQAYSYIRDIQGGNNGLNARDRLLEMQMWEREAEKNPVGTSVLSVLTSPIRGISYLGQVMDFADDGKIDQNAGYNRLSYIGSTIRNKVSEKIQESGKWGSFGSFLYQTGMSMGDFLLNTAITGGAEWLNLGIMGAGAAADTVIQAKDKGMEDWKAFTLGTIAGAAEILTEKFSVEALLNPDLMADGILKYIIKNTLTEGFEEVGSDMINILAETILTKSVDEWKADMEVYRRQHKTQEEAFALALAHQVENYYNALNEQGQDILLDFLGGAISGGVMSTVGGITGNMRTVSNSPDIDAMITESLRLNPNNETATKIKNAFADGKKISSVDVTRLQNQLQNDTQSAVFTDKARISDSVRRQLVSYGEMGDVDTLVQAITKYATGENLTRAEQQSIANSQYGRNVLNELNPRTIVRNDMGGNPRTDWARNIGTRVINQPLYNPGPIFDPSKLMGTRDRNIIGPKQVEMPTLAETGNEAADSLIQKAITGAVSVDDAQAILGNTEAVQALQKAVGQLELEGKTEAEQAETIRQAVTDYTDQYKQKAEAARQATQANRAVPQNVETVAQKYGKQAGAIRSIYNISPTQDIEGFANGVEVAYRLGYDGGLEADAVNSPATQALSETQRRLAYATGKSVRAAENETRRGNTNREGSVRAVGVKVSGNPYMRKGVQIVRAFSRMTGTTIELYNSNGKSPSQGSFNNKTDVIRLDVSAGINSEADLKKFTKYAMLRVFGHEFTHFGEKWAPAEYNILATTVAEALSAKEGFDLESRIREVQAAYKKYENQDLSWQGALDEIVAEGMTDVLPESQFFDRLLEKSPTVANKLLNSLKQFVSRLKAIIREYFSGLAGNLSPDAAALRVEVNNQIKYLDGIVDQWDRMMLNAVENYNRAQAEEEAAPATAKAEDIDQKGIQSVQDQNGHEMFNLRTMKQDVDYYMQDLRDAGLVGEGKALSETDLDYLYTSINRVMNYVERNIDAIERKESFREMDGTNRPFLPYKSNSDPHYKMALDYSTLCRKRLLTQAITERLQASLKRALTPVEQVRIRNEIKKLQAEGKKVDVACALCYVEAARLKSPKVINEFLNNKEAALKNYFSLANSRFKNEVYAKRQGDWKESRGLSRTATKDEINAKGFSVQEFNRFSVQIREQYWDWLRENDPEAYARERAIVDLAESTDNQEFLRADSLARMRRETPELYDAFITKVRQATRSKAQETDVPYARGDINSVSDALIEQMNNESGFRHQSWSDFQAMHLLDTVASIIELSTRKAKVHTYTKVADMVRLLGMTNMAINMSLIPAGETGLNEDGSLAFDPVEGIDYNTMVDLRKEFHKTAGNIAIGITDDQIRALMASPVIDYIIPYHTSGLNKDMRKRMGIRAWKDYTKYQNEVGSGAKPELHEWFNEQEAMAAADGVAYMVEASRKYLQLCHERGLVPKFPQFLQKNADGSYSLAEDAQNYWKLLIDRKMVDQYDNSVIIQQAVVPKFDVDVMLELLSNEVNSQAAIDAREAEDIIVQKMLDPERSPFTKAELEQAEKARALRDAALLYAIDDMREEVDADTQESVHDGSQKIQFQIRPDPKYEAENLKNGIDAIDSLINAAEGSPDPSQLIIENAMYRSEIGYIDFKWGIPGRGKNYKGGYGIAHIIAKRDSEGKNGKDIAYRLVEVIAKATDVDLQNNGHVAEGLERIRLHYNNYTAILVKENNGKRWLLTGWENEKKATAYAIGEGYGSSNATAAIPTLTRYDGVDAFASDTGISQVDSIRQEGAANSSNKQASLRTPTYTNRELLEMAANDVSIMGGLTQADRSALEIFKSRLDKLRGFEEQQAEQRRILQELQAAARPDRDEITKAQNRINLLGRKISAAENLVLDVENKQTLKKVLQHARNLAINQVRRNERALLQERSDVTKYRERVQAKAKRLSDMILKNSDKEHVPAALRGPLADFVASIGFDSRRKMSGGPDTKRDIKYTEALDRLRQIVQNQADYMANPENGSSLDFYLDLPEDFSLLIQEHLNQVTAAVKAFGAEENNQVFAMDSNELKRLDQILTIINHSVSQINKLHTEGRFSQVSLAAQQTIQDMNRRKRFNATERGAALRGFLEWKNTLPVYAFRKYGAAGQAIFEILQNGWEKFAFNSRDVIDFANKTYTSKEAHEWSNQIHSIELEDGRTVKMTTAQIMSLYCLNKREQARGHILGGGIRVGNIEAKQGRKTQTVTQTENFNLTPDDVKNITDELSDRQIEVADQLQKYMNTVGSNWGNEVSMERFGYQAFEEDNYFPIESDKTNLPAKDPEAKANDLFRLLNMSMTKALTPKANNALVVNNIFQVFAAHMSDMAKYNSLALPVLDAMKWINYKETAKNEDGQIQTQTVQRAIEQAYGREGMSYFLNFMKDLNGQGNGGRDEGMLNSLMSNYKVAAVAANLRVALLQPTSYFRASALLSPKVMTKATTMSRKTAHAERMKYSGISVWKDLGFFDTNIGRDIEEQIMHTETVKDKITDKALTLAEKGDSFTWDVLWNACKLDQQLKGVKEADLMQATAKRFMDVIYQTQVVDSTLTRTQLMRDKSALIKNITGFMSEPSLSYNLLLNAYEDFQTEAQQHGKAAAWNKTKGAIGAAFVAYVGSQLAAAIAESLMDAARDDDDYESYLDKWLQAFLGDESFLKGNLFGDMNPFAKIPLLKDVFSVASGYESTDMTMQWLEDLSNLGDALTAKNRPLYGKIYKGLQTASRITGLPLSNASREVATIWNNTLGTITGQKLRTYERAPKTVIKEAYEGGKLNEKQAIAELKDKAGMDDDAALKQVTSWKYSEWDTNGGGLSQDEVAIGLEEGNFTEKEKKQIWKDMGYKEKNFSDKQNTAKVILKMGEKAREYTSTTWKDGLQDSDLSNADKDRLVSAYGSETFSKQYNNLRSAGYTPSQANQLLESLSEWDTNGGTLSQADVANGLVNGKYTESQKKKIWKDLGFKEDNYDEKLETAKVVSQMGEKAQEYNSSDWKEGLLDNSLSSTDKDRLVAAYGADYFVNPYTSLRSAGYTPAEALKLLQTIDTDGNGSVKQAEAYAFLQGKSDAAQLWDIFGWKTDWATYSRKQH